MKKIISNHVGKIFFLTLVCCISWVINLLVNHYNPYTSFQTLLFPEKYLIPDTLIIQNEYSWSGDNITDTDALNYSFFGYLLHHKRIKKYDLTWARKDEVSWKLQRDTIINNRKLSYIPIYKSKIQDYSIYPVNDQSYFRNEIVEDFLLSIFFSIPIFSIPLFTYLLILGYIERKHEKKQY